jgi:hypothetical protein
LVGQSKKIVSLVLNRNDDGDPWLCCLCHEERKRPAREPCGGITDGILQKAPRRFKSNG